MALVEASKPWNVEGEFDDNWTPAPNGGWGGFPRGLAVSTDVEPTPLWNRVGPRAKQKTWVSTRRTCPDFDSMTSAL